MAKLNNTTIEDNGFLKFPVGTTSQRPSSPVAGMIRVNTDRSSENVLEYYDGSGWIVFGGFAPISATGGSVSTYTDANNTTYQIHAFTNTGNSTFTVQELGSRSVVDVLIVAGGGGGGGDVVDTGGGGAGGLIYAENLSVSAQSYTITVGAGGARETVRSSPGNQGEDSSAFGLTAIGGGGGASYNSNPGAGGSGGGGTEDTSSPGGAALQPGSPDGGFGNQGGSGGAGSSGGGGGGAGAAGAASTSTANGGDGLFYGDKFGTSFGENGNFAGGGGGGGVETGLGGLGGGGNGRARGENPTPGQPNTGGGGGGASNNNSPTGLGTDGGSGIVLIRYRI